MTEQEIIEGNELIAKFMGIPPCDRCECCGQYKFGVGIYYRPDAMEYHSSWDWLMPVIHKICKEIHDGPSREDWQKEERIAKKISTAYLSASIEMAWGCCIDYIQWHNTAAPCNTAPVSDTTMSKHIQ